MASPQKKVDQKLVIASAPLLLFGTVIRTLEDSGVLPYSFNPLEIGFYTHTPGLWVFIATLIIASFLFFKKLLQNTKIDYRNAAFVFGTVLFFASLFFLLPLAKNREAFFLAVGLTTVVWGISVFFAQKLYKKFGEDKLNQLIVFGQSLDGMTTFVASDIFDCFEQHFVSRFLVELFPGLLVLLKISVAILIIYFVDKEIKDQNFKNYLKWVVIAFGIMTGARNAFTLLAGNCN